MLSNVLTGAICFCAGALIGAATSYFISERKFIDQLETIRVYEKSRENADKSLDTYRGEESEVPVDNPSSVTSNTYSDIRSSVTSDPYKVDYAGYSGSVKLEDPSASMAPIETEEVYEIPEERFGEYREFESKYLDYYVGNHVLVDSERSEVVDIDNTTGHELLVEWPSSGKKCIRNESMAEDYEVTWVDSSWNEFV